MVVGEAMPGPPGISGPGGGQQPAERLWTDPKDSGLSSPLKEALSDGQWWEEVTPTLGKIPVMGGATPSLGESTYCGRGSPTPGRLNRASKPLILTLVCWQHNA